MQLCYAVHAHAVTEPTHLKCSPWAVSRLPYMTYMQKQWCKLVYEWARLGFEKAEVSAVLSSCMPAQSLVLLLILPAREHRMGSWPYMAALPMATARRTSTG